jgi:hypothetical protein
MVVFPRTTSSTASEAEVRVREIASRIGLTEDSEILQTVFHKMKEEYVVELWQLPALDSRQWDKLQAPVGLAVAVQRLASASSSSLARSASLASLFRLSHDRDQQQEPQQQGFRTSTSSIFRLSKDSSSTVIEGNTHVASVESMVEEEAVTALLSNIPSDLPPLDLNKSSGGNTCCSANSSDPEDQLDGLEMKTESRLEQNDSNHSKSLSQASMILDGCENSIMDERVVEEGKAGDDTDSETSINIPLNSECGEQPALTSAYYLDSRSSSSTEDILALCLADSDPEDVQVTNDRNKDPGINRVEQQEGETVNIYAATTSATPFSHPEIQVLCDSKEDLDLSREQDQEAERVSTDVTAPSTTTASTLFTTPEKQSMSHSLDTNRVEDQETEIVNISIKASPTTTAITLLPTPEKLSMGGNTDSPVRVEKTIFSRSEKSSPILAFTSSDPLLQSSRLASVTKRLTMSSSSDEEGENSFLEIPRTEAVNRTESLSKLLVQAQNFADSNNDDDNTVVVSNVSPEGQAVAFRRTKSELYSHPSVEGTYNGLFFQCLGSYFVTVRSKLRKSISILLFCPFCFCLSIEMAETSSYEDEMAQLQEILKHLPDEDHRSILSQLMIMSNARGKASRIKVALQLKDSLLSSMENHQLQGESNNAVYLILHLARLKKSYRQLFGKSIFKAMSKLYTKTEKKKGHAQQQQEPKKRNRRSVQPPLTIAIPTRDDNEGGEVTSPTQLTSAGPENRISPILELR